MNIHDRRQFDVDFDQSRVSKYADTTLDGLTNSSVYPISLAKLSSTRGIAFRHFTKIP